VFYFTKLLITTKLHTASFINIYYCS